jgi:HlyD family secretion protein
MKSERAEALRQLDILSCKAHGDGVLTMVAQEIGATIHKGDVIARIADLDAYRVEGSVSDIHSGKLLKGETAHVIWSGGSADGKVSSINPAVENGTITFSVALDNKADARLRSNLRVDIAVVTSTKASALRLAKGPFFKGTGPQELFVVHGSSAVRTSATIGAEGYEYVEITGGLEKNDEVIISDMTDYLHVREVRLK